MKRKLFTLVAILFINLIVIGQNLFIIGDKSCPCTNAIVLISNSDEDNNLEVFICKNGKSGLIGLNKKTSLNADITNKLNIYLVDGSVLICTEKVAAENVDDDAKALYNLTADQLNKLRASNIHTVKYSMTWLSELTFSASNKGIETREIINEFFKE